MYGRSLPLALLLATSVTLLAPFSTEGQVPNRLRRSVQNALESETARQLDRLLRNAVRCVFDDSACVERAKQEGKDVVLTNDAGEILMDADGKPITDPATVQQQPEKPGTGAWANYDFVPGDDILFYDDFTRDNVGDFPRRLELVQGNWEIVEWQGGRYLRATSNGLVAIPLPRTLPDRFTIEYSVNLTHGNAFVAVMPGRAHYGPARNYRGSAPTVHLTRAGVRSLGQGPTALAQFAGGRVRDTVVPFRIMADGDHMKVYLGEQRVANVPNAVFPRSDTLFIALGSAAESHPIMVGSIRIAAGGADLYDRLARDGRVATHGILFATGSARIRPESTPTLEEIGTMLKEHPELRLSIEGHTDDVGDDASNQTLSEQRAAAVKAYLVETYGLDAGRLQTAGFGETKPVVPNDSPEGRQQNRRVELVRLP
jgi:OmpA-OmpF porin, OOP family